MKFKKWPSGMGNFFVMFSLIYFASVIASSPYGVPMPGPGSCEFEDGIPFLVFVALPILFFWVSLRCVLLRRPIEGAEKAMLFSTFVFGFGLVFVIAGILENRPDESDNLFKQILWGLSGWRKCLF